MTIESATLGEDVPIQIVYDGGGTDPDDTGTDGTPDATITITDNSDNTEMISAVAMTHETTGTFTYTWDTAVDTNGSGVYVVEISAEFSGLTKIVKDTIRLVD